MSTKAREVLARIILEEYGALIERIARAIVNDAHLAEDIRQDVVIKLMENEEKISAMASNVLKRYIVTATKNRSIDIIREQSRRQEVFEKLSANTELTMDHIDSFVFVDENGFSHDMQQYLSELDYIDKDIIIMKYADGIPFKDIAALLGKSEDFVYQRAKRARDKLRKVIIDLRDGGRP